MMMMEIARMMMMMMMVMMIMMRSDQKVYAFCMSSARRAMCPSSARGTGVVSVTTTGGGHAPSSMRCRSARGPTDTMQEDEMVFRSWFRGEFDNAEQVKEERRTGLEPGESGGHEQIHCRLEALNLPHGCLDGSDYFIGATYYFDNRPEAVFRCRIYSFHPPPDRSTIPLLLNSPGGTGAILTEMRLHRFLPTFEAQIRSKGYDLSLLPRSSPADLDAVVEELEGCSILWMKDNEEEDGGGCFRGIMKHGSCIVGSQREAGVTLRIEDDLLLRSDRLYVNDRGTDCQTGRLIYGNYLGIPYQMYRRS